MLVMISWGLFGVGWEKGLVIVMWMGWWFVMLLYWFGFVCW